MESAEIMTANWHLFF